MDIWAVWAVLIIFGVGFLAISIVWGVMAHQRQVSAGKEGLVGKTAVVGTTLNPKGTVLIEGEQWTAVSESGRVNPGEEVTIRRVDGLKLYVIRK